MKSFIIAGNWKMNAGPGDAMKLASSLSHHPVLNSIGASNHTVVVCPPFVSLAEVRTTILGGPIQLGAQTCHHEPSGAYTGEISAEMLVHSGCRWVILGHSERRREQGETDELIGHKVIAALQAGLQPIVCVGESHAERLDGVTHDVISRQLQGIAETIGADRMGNVVIAYEPIWAIGTGLAATPEQAQSVHAFIRQAITWYTSRHVPILYGGSVTSENAASLFECLDIDGALVGGASLHAANFGGIIQAALDAGSR